MANAAPRRFSFLRIVLSLTVLHLLPICVILGMDLAQRAPLAWNFANEGIKRDAQVVDVRLSREEDFYHILPSGQWAWYGQRVYKPSVAIGLQDGSWQATQLADYSTTDFAHGQSISIIYSPRYDKIYQDGGFWGLWGQVLLDAASLLLLLFLGYKLCRITWRTKASAEERETTASAVDKSAKVKGKTEAQKAKEKLKAEEKKAKEKAKAEIQKAKAKAKADIEKAKAKVKADAQKAKAKLKAEALKAKAKAEAEAEKARLKAEVEAEKAKAKAAPKQSGKKAKAVEPPSQEQTQEPSEQKQLDLPL